MDFKALIAFIEKILAAFFGVLPQIQQQMLESVMLKTQQLELKGDQIRISSQNLKKLVDVQASMRKILLSDQYLKAVGNYAKAYNEVTKLQQSYFQTVKANYGGPALAKEMMKLAKDSVVDKLTENGLMANVAEPVKDIIGRAITSGSSYATLQEQLNETLAGKDGGLLERYTKQISTDAINQYSRQYSQLASADLGLEWFRYAGSNIKTTRPFCLACTDRKFFHVSEIPALLRGDFPEFKKYDGKIYDKTNLPQGMYPDTDVANFPTLLGGYNCGHQYRPVSDKRVPEDIRQRVYGSAEYKAWNGMDVKQEPGVKKKVSGVEERPVKMATDEKRAVPPLKVHKGNLADFVKTVIEKGKPSNLVNEIGFIPPLIQKKLRKEGVELVTDKIFISDKKVLRHLNHKKRAKGATLSVSEFSRVEAAVNNPQLILRDKKSKTLVYVFADNYNTEKMIKVIVEPNYSINGNVVNLAKSIGVVSKRNIFDKNSFEIVHEKK